MNSKTFLCFLLLSFLISFLLSLRLSLLFLPASIAAAASLPERAEGSVLGGIHIGDSILPMYIT